MGGNLRADGQIMLDFMLGGTDNGGQSQHRRRSNRPLHRARAATNQPAQIGVNAAAMDHPRTGPNIPIRPATEGLQETAAKPTVKLHLAAIRVLFDWPSPRRQPLPSAFAGQACCTPGKTPGVDRRPGPPRAHSIDTSTIVGLCDRALIGVMIYNYFLS
jgi:hypothetical protein